MTDHKTFPQTISWLKPELLKNNIRPNKRFGQNFLIDQNILSFIVNAGDTNNDDVVLEIGTGTAALTNLLAEKAGSVVTVEIDKGLYAFAQKIAAGHENIVFINKDVIINKSHLEPDVVNAVERRIHTSVHDEQCVDVGLKVIANLPYNISTPLIINLLESDFPLKLMVLTLQKDITNRLSARPGTKDYGILSVISQYFCRIDVLKHLPPDVFWPSPKIDSSIVKLVLYNKNELKPISDYNLFRNIVKTIFMSRRKTICNSLKVLYKGTVGIDLIRPVLKKVGIDPKVRGEALDVGKIIELTNRLDNSINIEKA